ncbi:MAG: NUDIX domain-containing protein [Chloroflexi bacterium]|nr:NUDIX domain-containing protein [Chloroflexota bacterium]
MTCRDRRRSASAARPTDTLVGVSHRVPACPHCATAGERPLVCDRCGWRWYANPSPAAAVLLERDPTGPDPSILLLRRAVEPGLGAWDLPAGYLDPGESFEAAARRETREESGIEVQLVSLTGVYHSPAANAVTAVYRARAQDENPTVRTDSESSEHAWVSRSAIDEWLPRIAFPSMASAIADWAAGRLGDPRPDAP